MERSSLRRRRRRRPHDTCFTHTALAGWKGHPVATVKNILADKGGHVWSVGPGATVLDAALLMNEHKIGALLVMEGGQLAGIFTERDVLRRVVGEARNPASTPVADVMSREVICCSPEMTLEEARGVMKNRRIRHLPVMEGDDHLLGLVSIGDLNAHQEHAQERHIHLLNEYLYGRGSHRFKQCFPLAKCCHRIGIIRIQLQRKWAAVARRT